MNNGRQRCNPLRRGPQSQPPTPTLDEQIVRKKHGRRVYTAQGAVQYYIQVRLDKFPNFEVIGTGPTPAAAWRDAAERMK